MIKKLLVLSYVCVCVSADGCFSPQLPGDWRDIRGVLERHRGQSRSQRIRWIGELCCTEHFVTHVTTSLVLYVSPLCT